MSDRCGVSRRAFLRLSMAGVAGLLHPALTCRGQVLPRGAGVSRPNVVVLIADDLGWADIGYHGSEIETPNLDRLAREGIRLEHHYVMATCTPTRVGLMTGHYPSRYGVTSPAYGQIFNDDTITLPEALRRGGYTTHISGKWHMGSPPDYTPLKYGFDSSYGYFHGQCDPYTHYYKTGVRSWHRNDEYLDEEGHATDLITNEAIRVIESPHEKPFFLYVAYSVPHHPLCEPQERVARYEGRIEEISRRWFAASVTHMDDGIGRIIAALDRANLRQNTLVVFSSDNGGQKDWQSDKEYKGRYADKPHTVLGNNRPLRGWKGELYEGGIRVPALVNWPGVLKAGELDAPLHVVDWMPTLCQLTGSPPGRDLRWDGHSIWPLLTGQTAAAEPRTLYWKTPNGSAARSGDWKLIVRKGQKNAELYNVVSDPYETQDLAAREPQRVSELKRLLKQFAANDRDR